MFQQFLIASFALSTEMKTRPLLDGKTYRDLGARYVVNAFCWKKAELIHFTFRNESVLKLATRLFNSTNGSEDTLYQYVFGVNAFFKWLDKEPDVLVRDYMRKRSTKEVTEQIDNIVRELKANHLAPGTIANYIKGVKQLFRANGMEVILPYKLDRRVKHRDNAPTSEELEKELKKYSAK